MASGVWDWFHPLKSSSWEHICHCGLSLFSQAILVKLVHSLMFGNLPHPDMALIFFQGQSCEHRCFRLARVPDPATASRCPRCGAPWSLAVPFKINGYSHWRTSHNLWNLWIQQLCLGLDCHRSWNSQMMMLIQCLFVLVTSGPKHMLPWHKKFLRDLRTWLKNYSALFVFWIPLSLHQRPLNVSETFKKTFYIYKWTKFLLPDFCFDIFWCVPWVCCSASLHRHRRLRRCLEDLVISGRPSILLSPFFAVPGTPLFRWVRVAALRTVFFKPWRWKTYPRNRLSKPEISKTYQIFGQQPWFWRCRNQKQRIHS